MNRLCAAIVLIAAISAPVHAQQVSLGGRVTDATTGQSLEGAEVRLVGPDTIRVRTDARGEWQVLRLRQARYDLTVRALGFRTVVTTVDARAGVRSAQLVELVPVPRALDRVVVTAAKREQRLADVVTTTELISREDISRSGASDLGGVLGARTGVELAGGHPQGVGAMLQGLGSERVLVLLDGQPIPGRIAGEFDISRIPTTMIERVEIVKGPQSTLYGTDAMGGVVNIITRAPALGARREMSVSGIAGSQNRRDVSANATTSLGPVAVRGELGRRYIETTPGRPDEHGTLAERFDGALNVKWKSGETTTFDARMLALDERQRFLSSGLYTFADNVQVTGRVAAERELRSGTVRASVYGSVYDHLSRASALPEPIRGDTGQRQVQRLFQAELTHTRNIGAHVLDVGAQVRRDDTKSVRIPGGRRAITTIEPLVQVELALPTDASVVAGARLSHSDQWGDHFTPRVALRYRANQSLTFRASAGTGFRAPDFRELYMSFVNNAAGYAVNGNPELRPESSQNVMAGLEWATDAAFARTQLFHNEFRDFIETRVVSGPGQPLVFEYGNVADGYTRGLELEAGTNVGRLTAEAGYSLLNTYDRTTGFDLLGRPPHSARLSLTHPFALGIRGSVIGIYTGRTAMSRDASGAINGWRDAYPQINAHVAREIGGRAELSLNIDNMLDRRPAQWAGFTGRQVFVGVRWNSN